MRKVQRRVENLETNLRNALQGGTQNTKLFLDLGRAYDQLYEASHQAETLESAIKHYKSGLEYDPLDKVYHGTLLYNLAGALMTRFRRLGEIQDLQDVIAFHEQALVLRPAGHKDRAISLYEIAAARVTRFQKLEEMEDLQQAITFHEEALSLCPAGHAGQLLCLAGLAHALITRFMHLDDIKDLQEAIVFYQKALELCPSGHPSRSISLGGLARGLISRFRKLEAIEDLQEGITLYEQALRLRPAGHPGRPAALRNLAGALITRFKQLEEIKDLKMAIEFYERGLRLCPDGHPGQLVSLKKLAQALMIRFKHLGEIKDLQQAIGFHEKALELCTADHPERSDCLDDLALAMMTRFKQLKEMKDLEEAVTLYEQSLTLCPPGHLDRPVALNNLANTLLSRFEELEELADLQTAMTHCEQALELCSPGHPFYTISLNNLAHAFMIRFEEFEDVEDLQKGINLYEEALELYPLDHHGRSVALNRLADVLLCRFQKLEDIKDLQKAIALQEQALDLCLTGSPQQLNYLGNLAFTLKIRAQKLNEMKDLGEAIALCKKTLELCPDGHPKHPMYLKNLATIFLIRFECTGDKSDLESARSGYTAALLCLPPNHPLHGIILSCQASLIMVLHKTFWVPCYDCSHIDEACMLLELASNYATSTLQQRSNAASRWARMAHKHQHKSMLTAYSTGLLLQQQLLALLPPWVSQQKQTVHSFDLIFNATTSAISAGKLETAVEFLEQERSILWSIIRGYKHPFEELSAENPELAKKFKAISHQLKHHTTPTDVDMSHQQAFSEKWTALLGEIRKLDGFSNYLQITPFEALQDVAKEGPIIMVSINEFHSDAIILVPSTTPVVVTLQDATPATLGYLVQWLSEVTTGTRPSKDIIPILQHLWNFVVQPVVNQLAQLQVLEKSHIWWCPTSYFSALPLHAAGPYKKGLKNLPDLYISSYTPTLGSLIKARANITKSQFTSNLLLVSLPDNTFPGQLEEIKIIEGFGKQMHSCSGQDVHREAVLASLQSHPWVHFACHGYQVMDQSFKPWFQLHGGEHLTVLDLEKSQLPNVELAFISMCHSAGPCQSPNKFNNLTTTLQFCGFKSVIGTLWGMVDDVGPVFADAFYKHMFRNADTVDVKEAAEALNIATRKLRKQNIPLEQWINLIHVGV